MTANGLHGSILMLHARRSGRRKVEGYLQAIRDGILNDGRGKNETPPLTDDVQKRVWAPKNRTAGGGGVNIHDQRRYDMR